MCWCPSVCEDRGTISKNPKKICSFSVFYLPLYAETNKARTPKAMKIVLYGISVLFLAALTGCERPVMDPLENDYDEEECLTRTDSISEDSTGITITIVAPEWEVYKYLTF